MASKLTRTTNRIHFTDLDPLRFEDLCLNIISRIHEWKELNHFGRKGTDNGVDIHAIQQIGSQDYVWFIQCKRYTTIGKTDIREIIDAIAQNSPLPDKLLIIISCSLSRANYDYCQGYSSQVGIKETEVWTESTLEARLYNDHKDLLFVYFGVRLERTKQDNAARVKASLAMEKKFLKDFINHSYMKDSKNWNIANYEPFRKFISSKVFIHSVDDTTYPEGGPDAGWFMNFIYNTYHNGVEFWLDGAIGTTIIMDEKGNWEVLESSTDIRTKNPKYRTIRAMRIGRMPYYNIVGYKTEGDEYYQYPHIYCKYSFDGSPFESVIFRSLGIADEKKFPHDFDKTKEVKFPL